MGVATQASGERSPRTGEEETATSPAPPRAREPVRYFFPGPAYVRRDTLEAMVRPMVSHRSLDFQKDYASVSESLRTVFQTQRPVYTATGSSTLLMESAVVSTARDRVLSLCAGAFSERWFMICRNLAKTVDRIQVPWGQPVDPELVREALRGAQRRSPYEVVTVVHNETSTGVLQPLEEIVRAVREESDALVLVDAVSSLGGAPVDPEGWDLDLVLTGSQKALALPPGLVFFTLSERLEKRAYDKMPRGWYTDLLRYRDVHREKGGTIATPNIPVLYAAEQQLRRVVEEGMEARFERHRRMAALTAEWAQRRGLTFASEVGFRSPTVSCLRPPEGLDPQALVAALAAKGFTVGGGYGQWKESTFRIGHMGEVFEDDLERLFPVIDQTLEELKGSATATEVLASAP